MITLDALDDLSGLRHGFFTREGGVSEGHYASLNCGFGSGDEPARVAENRARIAARLAVPAGHLVTVYQIHSPTVVVADQPWRPDRAPEADAMVTNRPGLALGILTADCVPVLFADPASGVIGAAHAGWKGACGGVVAATVAAMVTLGARPARMVAAVGPCIAQRSYEVGPEFPGQFAPADADFFTPAARPGHYLFDIGALVERRLADQGIGVIQRCSNDTAAEEQHFFSYRRATLRGEPVYGRGLSVIVLDA
ncbi:MAG: peptidoglycan editing factor PgeF [Rhodospirillaceae bacterium]